MKRFPDAALELVRLAPAAPTEAVTPSVKPPSRPFGHLQGHDDILALAQRIGVKPVPGTTVFKVAVVGTRGVGKSGLVNDLVFHTSDTSSVKPFPSRMGNKAVTTVAAFIHPTKGTDRYVLTDAKGGPLNLPPLENGTLASAISTLVDLRSYINYLNSHPPNDSLPVVHVHGPFPNVPENVVLIDCPGWADMDSLQFHALLVDVDAMIFVTPRSPSRPEVDALYELAFARSERGLMGGRRIPLVVSAVFVNDDLGDDEGVVKNELLAALSVWNEAGGHPWLSLPAAGLERAGARPPVRDVPWRVGVFARNFLQRPTLSAAAATAALWRVVEQHALSESARLRDYRAHLALKYEIGYKLGWYGTPNGSPIGTAMPARLPPVSHEEASAFDWKAALQSRLPANLYASLFGVLDSRPLTLADFGVTSEDDLTIRQQIQYDNYMAGQVVTYPIGPERTQKVMIHALVAVARTIMLRDQFAAMGEALGLADALVGQEELAVFPVLTTCFPPPEFDSLSIGRLDSQERWASVGSVMAPVTQIVLQWVRDHVDEKHRQVVELLGHATRLTTAEINALQQ